MVESRKPDAVLALLIAAVLANCAAGLLYVWSLFILPIEGALALDRADLGLISSLSLISFTAGVSVFPLILRRIGRIPVAILAFALIAGGHLAFGLIASWTTLAIGYGIGFGAGSGMAYGLALSLAASLPAKIRAPGIGLALGAFALSGIVLPIVLGGWINITSPDTAFMRIGLVTLAVGALCALTLLRISGDVGAQAATDDAAVETISIDRPFMILSFIFFLICFTGLAVVSQAAAIAAAAGIASAGYAATALTLGYLGGSLLGAPLAEKTGERRILLTLGLLSLAGALTMLSSTAAILYLGAFMIGMTFGGAGSIMPVLLGMRYGAANISRLYGRMIIAYGLAGLVAPGVAGMLYKSAASYTVTLGLCAVLALLAMAVTFALDRQEPAEEQQIPA